MSGDGQWQLQKAVYTALVTAHGATKVFDHVPQNTPGDYVALGDAEASEFDTDTEIGQEHVVTVHHYARSGEGKRATLAMQKRTYDALHDQSLTLDTGAALVLLFYTFSTVVLDPDGKTYHGVSQFRAITTES